MLSSNSSWGRSCRNELELGNPGAEMRPRASFGLGRRKGLSWEKIRPPEPPGAAGRAQTDGEEVGRQHPHLCFPGAGVDGELRSSLSLLPFPGGAGCCSDRAGGVFLLKTGIIGVSEAPSPAATGPFSAASCLVGAAKGQGTVPTHLPVPWVCYFEIIITVWGQRAGGVGEALQRLPGHTGFHRAQDQRGYHHLLGYFALVFLT